MLVGRGWIGLVLTGSSVQVALPSGLVLSDSWCLLTCTGKSIHIMVGLIGHLASYVKISNCVHLFMTPHAVNPIAPLFGGFPH